MTLLAKRPQTLRRLVVTAMAVRPYNVGPPGCSKPGSKTIVVRPWNVRTLIVAPLVVRPLVVTQLFVRPLDVKTLHVRHLPVRPLVARPLNERPLVLKTPGSKNHQL